LLLGELLKTLRAERVQPDAAHVDVVRHIGPRAVARTVLLRLSRLAADAVGVARAVSVLGDGASVSAVAALAGLEKPEVADAAFDLARAEILRSDSSLGFVHPLVRDVIYHDLRPSERERHHALAASVLNDSGASPEFVAAHLILISSRRPAWAGDVFWEAGLAASGRGDADAAVSYLRLALEASDDVAGRPQLLFDLGMAEGGLDAAAAGLHMRQAYDGLTDPFLRAMAARVLARMLLFTSTADEAVAVVRQAADELPADLVDYRKAYEAFELYAPAFGAEVPGASERLAIVRAEGGGEIGVGARMLRAVAAWDWAMTDGSAERCAEMALEALADGKLVAADPGFGAIIAGGVLALADREEAVEVFAAAMVEAERLGSLRTVCLVNIWKGFAELQRGELAAASATLGDAAEQIRTLETNGVGMAYIAAFLARVRMGQGDLAGAHEVLASAPDDRPPSDGDALVRRSTIELLLAERRWPEALSAIEAYRRRLRGERNPTWAPWRSLEAQALDGLGQRQPAMALLEAEIELARGWGAPGALAHALRLLATMRPASSLALLEEAVQVTEGSTAQLERARSLVAIGSAMHRAGRGAEGRDRLQRGLDVADRCGARALAEQARAGLLATGARPRRGPLTGPAALTPSERRVADLAAEGRRNREIAQALYVSTKTVEVHLTSVYRKLGIATRAELGAALAV
jgi:DNA-binding CsgD family transcriptional regulator